MSNMLPKQDFKCCSLSAWVNYFQNTVPITVFSNYDNLNKLNKMLCFL